MRIRKGLLIGLICMLIAAMGLFCFAACNPDKPNPDGPTVDIPGDQDDGDQDDDKSDIGTDVGDVQEACEHTYGEWTVTLAATCNTEGELQRKCSKCNNVETDVIEKLQHKFTKYVSDGNATCTADGTKTATCDNKDCTETDTVVDAGSKKGHKLEVTSHTDPTCVTHGQEVRTCKNEGCDYTETKQIIATGHIWNAAEATCTEGLRCTVEGCTATKPALGHNYVTQTVEKTCTTDGKIIHTCTHCNDSYDTDVDHATGHKVSVWSTTPGMQGKSYGGEENEFTGELVEGETCKYRVIHYGVCEECGQTVASESETVRHTLIKIITKPATCTTHGELTTRCSLCDEFEPIVEDYENEGAHKWVENGNGTECEYCHKTIVNYTDEGVDKTALSNSAVAVENATLALDEETLSGINGEKVTISVQPVTDYTPPEGVNVDQVFEFTLGVDNKPVTQFGGYITVTLPYTLNPEEDPEDIGVWYLNDSGKPEQYKAKYFEDENGNGFVTFKTNHFSKYTVTRLTAKQRCELYGHSWKTTTVPVSCTTDGYEIRVCQRCALTERVELGAATGHHFVSDTSKTDTVATCTADGFTYLVCDHDGCDYKLTQKTPALGHDWVDGDDDVVATCTHSGKESKSCSRCDASYTLTTAQLQHNFTSTVHAATCTEGGYTTFTCKYCQTTYNGDYTEAKGHTYVESTVAPTCTATGHTLHKCADCGNEYKTDEVPAKHTWDIPAPTCGKGQTCLICGAKGEKATGAHTMKDGICTVCGTGCEHTNTVTVHAPSCTERGYTSRICTKCGREERSDYKDALGHEGTITCTRCHKQLLGEQFFTNTISSVLNKDFAIRATDVLVEAEGTGYKLDFGELFVTYDANGEIYGYGSGTLLGTDESFPDTMAAGITAVISGGYIYVKSNMSSMFGGSNGGNDGYIYNDVMVSTQYIVIPFSKLSMEQTGTDSDNFYKLIPLIYDQLQTEIIPLVNTLLELNGKDISALTGEAVEKFFTLEKSGSGYVLTLKTEMINELSDNLYNHSIADNVDILFGEGTFASLKETVLKLADTTLEEIIVTAMQKGLSTDEILELADEICVTVTDYTFGELTGYDTESIKQLLNNEQFLATTVLDLVNEYLEMQGADLTVTKEMITEYIDEYSSLNAYELIAGATGIDKAELKEYVDFYLDSCLGNVEVKLSLDIYGNVTGGVLGVEQTELDIDGTIVKVKGTLTLTDKVSSNVNYAAVAEEVKTLGDKFELTVPAVKALYPNAKVETYDNGTVKSVEGRSENVVYTDEYDDGYYVDKNPETGEVVEFKYTLKLTRYRVSEFILEFGENPEVMLYTDCGNWYFVSLNAESGFRREYEYEIRQRFLNGDLVNEERRDDGGNHYGGSSSLGYYYNIVTGRVKVTENGYFNGEIMHNFKEDTSKFVKCGDGCREWGQRHYYCTDCGKTFIKYYANDHKTAVKFEPLTGNTIENCEDGYYVVRYCTECDEEIYRYVSYGHNCWEVYTDAVDLSGYDVCEDHYFRVYSCACGKEQFTDFNFPRDTYDGGEDGLGNKYEIFGCDSCGLTVKQEMVYVYDKEHCESTYTTIYTISYNGNVLKAYNDVHVEKSHQSVMRFVELAEGAKTCEDGVIVSDVCLVCGEVVKTYTTRGHETGVVKVVDLKEYGAACGEKLYIFGCACGEYDDPYGQHYQVTGGQGDDFGTVDGGYNNNEDLHNGYWIYDSLEIKRCAVTDPVQCRLTFAVKEYMSENGCYAYRKYMIGYNVEDGTAAYSFEELIQTWHNYVSGEPVAIGGCRYKLVYTCSRCGDSYEEEYTQHTVGEEPEHIEGCRYGYKCAVCGEYVDTLYMHDLEWIEGKNCRWELTCSECGAVVQIEFRHEFEWVNTEGCLWSYECAGCGRVQTTEYRHSWTVDLEPTCTQFGEHHCTECNLHEVLFPDDHDWFMDEDGLYHCHNCDITNTNGVSGDIVLENYTETLGDGTKYVAGFYLSYYNKANQYRYDGEFLLNVSLMLTDAEEGEDDQVITDVEVTFNSHGGGNYVEFSKADVEAWAAENGYAAGSYEVRLSFVPRGWQCDFDYAITF